MLVSERRNIVIKNRDPQGGGVRQETYKGIEANVASVLAVEVGGALEEGHGVREVALHLHGGDGGCKSQTQVTKA
jgi:hypothetical protein